MIPSNFFRPAPESRSLPLEAERDSGTNSTILGTFEITISREQSAQSPRYSTFIRHLQTDRTLIFEGFLSDRLHTWMQEQLTAESASTPSNPAELPAPMLQITAVTLLQTNNPNSPIAVAIPQQTIAPRLSSTSPFILELTFELLPSGQQQLSQSRHGLSHCQVQVFAKPLSPIRSTDHWHATLSLPLSATQPLYTAQFQPVLLGTGLYSLQLLVLMSGLSAYPLLLEVPVFQVS